jgi:metallophosphoesterase superfamily enzyme
VKNSGLVKEFHLGYPPAITEDGEMMISDRTEELLDQMRSQLVELKPDQVWVVEDIMLKFRKSLEQ